MSTEKIRIGIIGVGQIGKSHVAKYREIDQAEIVAVADLNDAERTRVAAENDIPHHYADFRKMLKRDDIDAVDVCLHNNFHMPVSVAGLEAGKHVYCEKPIAGCYADGATMLEAAQQCNRKLAIQLATVFSPETKVAKRLIDAGRLGKLYHARSVGHRRRGRPFVDGYGTESFVKQSVAAGGALYDMGVYHIAQILYLIGMPQVERISGKTYQEVAMDAARRAQSGFDVEELGLGFVKCADGVTLDIFESWAVHMGTMDSSCVMGNQGGIRMSPFSLSTSMDDVDADTTFDVSAANWRWHQLNPDEDAYDSPQHHWIAELQGRVKTIPCAEIALRTMLISEGIYLSNKLGREVTAAEVVEQSVSTAARV